MIIPLDVDPVAFSVGGIAVRWYGLIAVLAVAVTIAIARRGAARKALPFALVDDGAVWVGVAALVGGRVLYLLQNESRELAANPLHAFAIWHGGLSFYGGLIAGLVALWLFARQRSVAFGLAADLVAPAAAAGQAVGHIGCLIGGDSYGLPTAGPLAVVYGNPGTMAPLGIPLHPTQLYEAVALGLLALALVLLRSRIEVLGSGGVAAAYLIGNAVIRFGLFFLRDDVIVAGGLKTAQLIAIGIAFAGIAWLIALRRPAAHPRFSEAWR